MDHKLYNTHGKSLKKPYAILKIQFKKALGNPFFDFYNMDRKSSKNNFRIEIGTFSFQICFRNKYWSSGSGQTINAQICVLKKKIFGQYLKKSKNGFPIVF